MLGREVCVFHDPTREDEGRRARRAGGEGRSRTVTVLPRQASDYPLQYPQDALALLSETINQVRRGEIDVRIANAIGYLTGMLLRTMEQASATERLIAHEARAHSAAENLFYSLYGYYPAEFPGGNPPPIQEHVAGGFRIIIKVEPSSDGN
jgi:hypothetical protein